MAPPLSFVVPQPPPPICGVPVVKESCGLAVQQLQVCPRLVPAVRLRAINMMPPLRATFPQRSPVMVFPSPFDWWADPRFGFQTTFRWTMGQLEWPHHTVSHGIKEGKITERVLRHLPGGTARGRGGQGQLTGDPAAGHPVAGK